ncbi:MAG: adenosylmethionine decarboxylase [Candidatus Sericytochromatia bacterium]|nr:adenosylmethionine decarboxylase [Candidatus Sericytochromatia bacterium]
MVKTDFFGPHLTLDLNDCNPEKLRDFDLVFDILNNLPDKIGMTKITQPYVFKYQGLVPEDVGITGFVVIAESHISIHTFQEKNYVFIDLFSCKPFDYTFAEKYLIEIFESKTPTIQMLTRGHDFPRSAALSGPPHLPALAGVA